MNIWERPAARTSNLAKSLIYIERAKLILLDIEISGAVHPAVGKRGVSRRHLASAIGCSYPALTQNAEIRQLVAATDGKLKRQESLVGRDASIFIPRQTFQPIGVQKVIRAGGTFSKIVFTTRDFLCGGKGMEGVPAIVFSEGVHEESSDWLRYLVVNNKLAISSAYTYAKTLRLYLKLCRRSGLDWKVADDDALRKFHLRVLNGRKEGTGYTNGALQVVFQFYVYCEQSGVIKYRVGCYERAELPESFRRIKFPITAVRVVSGGEYAKSFGWATPLLHRNVASSVGNRATPNNESLELAHREALKRRTGVRDTTILRLVEDSGGRRAEVLQVEVLQIPSLDKVDDLAETADAWWPIAVVRKGGRKEVLRAQPDTLYAIHAYLRERAAVVKRVKGKNLDYKEPLKLFISSTTGKPLHPDSLTSIVGKLFKLIGLRNANIHRVRAKFAVDAVETVLDGFLEMGIEFAPGSNWIETILQQVAIRMGHKRPSSLKHYLTVALERRVRLSYASRDRDKEKIDRNARVEIAVMYRRAKFASRLLADMDTRAGMTEQAALLRVHAAELEARES